jgi:NADH-quinone oxidoreductase subunit E
MAARKPARNQPSAFAWTPQNLAWCEEQIRKYPPGRQASCVIPFLWRGQKQEGWVSIPMIETIARQLGMPYIRVYEVATFYSMFNLRPVGDSFIQVCGTTPCMLRGAEALKEVCTREIGEADHVSADGKLSWAEVECLGACVNAPMVQVSTKCSDHYFEDLSPARLHEIIAGLRRGETPKSGTQDPERRSSDPAGLERTLTDPSLYDGSRAAPMRELPNAAQKTSV